MRNPRRSYRIVTPVLAGLQALLLVSCEASRTLDPFSADDLTSSAIRNNHRAHDIIISASDSSLAPGQHVQATASVKDARGRDVPNASITWVAASQEVASVSGSGEITGGSEAGTATISATADGVTGTMDVTVAAADVADTTSNSGAADTTSAQPDSATTKPVGAAVHMVSITANATTLKVGEATQVSGVVARPVLQDDLGRFQVGAGDGYAFGDFQQRLQAAAQVET